MLANCGMSQAKNPKAATAVALDVAKETPIAASAPADAAAEIAYVVAISRAYRQGRREGLAVSREEADRELLLLRDGDIRTDANDRYSGRSQRAKAEAVAADMLRHAEIRRRLGGVALSAAQIRRILRGERSGS